MDGIKLNYLLAESVKFSIRKNLSDDFLAPKFAKLKIHNNSNMFGHCYIASEAAYYLLCGKKEGWMPQYIFHEENSHWYLKHNCGYILDITVDQFKIMPNYLKGKGKGFLTSEMSARTLKLISKITEYKSIVKANKNDNYCI